ncbi:MAG: anaerobic glycerol-3-phosphate dehydrogenase subunit B, partial [Desulfovibrio sp.]|nr:anaerobic glycerol-3-phosphate dehydrogenase subunit B [Desulfovibrio sp.]
ISGVLAAIRAKTMGAEVLLLGRGCGTAAISCGCIDLLGTQEGINIEDPWAGIAKLPPTHPYSLLGIENITQALDFFTQLTTTLGLPYSSQQTKNSFLSTILGTLKPSYLIPPTLESKALFTAKSVLIVGVHGLRDLSPKLAAAQLQKHPPLRTVHFETTMLPSPYSSAQRSLSSLDLARFVNTPQGLDWLDNVLGRFANHCDLILLPPILGTTKTIEILQTLQSHLHTSIREMLSIPPAVGGFRLHSLLIEHARNLGVRVFENMGVNANILSKKSALAVLCKTAQNEIRLQAKAYILATGGILGSGLSLTPTGVQETVFNLPVTFTTQSNADIFATQEISRIGVKADHTLRPVFANGDLILDNVYLAGRILQGYDQAAEKSGHGVAISTAYLAGKLAAKTCGYAENLA